MTNGIYWLIVKIFLSNMPAIPLNALRTFEAVASRLSFAKGAEALNVTPAAVSSQIRSLEQRLNQSLFHRQGRQISLTEAGRNLLLLEFTDLRSALVDHLYVHAQSIATQKQPLGIIRIKQTIQKTG